LKAAGRLPDDLVLNAAVFTYASDLTLLSSTLVPHGTHIGAPGLMTASLDHTMWFHRPFRADEWMLYDQTSPSAAGGLGFAVGRVFSQDGGLVASVAQEGLIRQGRA
jgi:acyl-CoA thioesterase-2